MNDFKINIPKVTLDVNLTFYFFFKHLAKLKLTEKQSLTLHRNVTHSGDLMHTLIEFKGLLPLRKLDEYDNILNQIEPQTEDVFVFALQLYLMKGLLLQEAKIKQMARETKLASYDLLSLIYDRESSLNPYAIRISDTLLSLISLEKIEKRETNFISKQTEEIVDNLFKLSISLQKKGLEPNQIFMLMFSESVNQSIISDSGSDYESRIFNVLTKIGIPAPSIKKVHDELDSSTEYDFLFELNGKTFGIGAKKTLRERYKQFIKTSLTSPIDVTIQITLGLDLNEEKAKTIRQHGTILFVAEEIYNARPFLQQMEGVFSSTDLTLQTLENLAK